MFELDNGTCNIDKKVISHSEVLKNFPFGSVRESQSDVIKQICEAFDSGCRFVVLEAPTGFGKSPVAAALAKTLGSSYICTATKELQSQYCKDFPFIKIAKGKNNFTCLVKDDLVNIGSYNCNICDSKSNRSCTHKSCEHGKCLSDDSFKNHKCKYKTSLDDYEVVNKGCTNELVRMNKEKQLEYENQFSSWDHVLGLNSVDITWKPCEYFDQLNIALAASHSIFNYAYLLPLFAIERILPPRELLVLDEAHLLESELVKYSGFSISQHKWGKFIKNFRIPDLGYDDVKKWIGFLISLESNMIAALGSYQSGESEILAQATFSNSTNSIVDTGNNSANQMISTVGGGLEPESMLYESRGKLEGRKIMDNDLLLEARTACERLGRTIQYLRSDSKNWIVSHIEKESNDIITKVELKPLDIAPYCRSIFERCSRTLLMSGTILDINVFAKTIGLPLAYLYTNKTKFIQVQSDFPVKNRPIYPLNIAQLNRSNLQLPKIRLDVAKAVDDIMTYHANQKGIIHTTSYDQVNLIKEHISAHNSKRLINTDPEIERDDVLNEHRASTTPTVLISPSFNTGIDLHDELSRFQIITKIPFPNLSDRWISMKRKMDEGWYYWQTALKLCQAYGRSIRSKDDWATTYVLDSGFEPFTKKNRGILPKWFISAISPVYQREN